MQFSFLPRTTTGFFAQAAMATLIFSGLSVSGSFAQSSGAAASPELPAAPAAAPATLTFAMPDPKNFTADKPSVAEVDAFLKTTWGYDPNRAWQVEAINKTAAAGVSRIIVAVGQKSDPSQAGQLVFYSLPDGEHIITGDQMVPFGAHPFEADRKLLQAEATGPARGSASKDLLVVEFADFQCPHCKDAQPTIDRLVEDFPNARFVFESFPLPMHSEAPKAAAYGVCVQKAAGDAAFFKYADAVFTNQAGLTPEQSDTTLKDVVTKLGLDPAKIAACAASAEGVKGVNTSLDLAHKLEVRETPWMYVNGRGLPVGGVPYDQLKAILSYQAVLDGVTSAAASPGK